MTFSALRNRNTTVAQLCLLALMSLGIALTAQAKQAVDPQAAPNQFVETVSDNALSALRQDDAAQQGDLNRINALVNEYVLPYVNLEKTSRLAAGRYWRQASEQQ